ncbi:MAG: S9 family peptidase, partial [Candidatus Heimdallarchaeota archaeon]|nr:S9 family peptidase [Candidatus Heimdallarchaeota archaeon]
ERVKKWVESQNNFTDYHLPKQLVEKYKMELKDFIYFETESPQIIRENKAFYSKKGKEEELSRVIMKNLKTNDEKILLNPNEWSDDYTDNIYNYYPSFSGNYLVYVKVLGGDEWAATSYILDVNSGKLIDDPIPNTRLGSVAWNFEEGFYYTRYPEKNEVSETEAYTQRDVYYHKLGTSIAEDKLIYKNKDPQVISLITSTLDKKDCMIFLMKGWSQNDVYVYRTELGFLEAICENISAKFDGNIVGNFFIAKTDYLAPNGRIIKIDLRKPEVENWETIIPENDYPLDFPLFYGEKLIARYLEDSYHQVYIYDLNGVNLGKIELPSIGSVSYFVGIWDSNEFQFYFASFLQPYTVFKANIDTFETEIVFQPELDLNLEKYLTELKWYESKDGTQIPMFLTMKKDTYRNGMNLVLLYGYGGFSYTNIPYYNSRNAFLLEQGFILAYPSIRGGNEFGEEWHQGGMRGNKQNVFDDFIAAAEWLIQEQYTQSKLLTIEGVSNGGLLTGAVLSQRPELIGNALVEVPVLDMVRYHKFYNAQPWIDEYGNPEKAEEFKFLIEYSPYHKVSKERKYPSILLTTNVNDKRVHPMHAFKMTAKMQKIEKSNPVLLRTITKAGHGVVSREQQIEQEAEIVAFIMWRSRE